MKKNTCCYLNINKFAFLFLQKTLLKKLDLHLYFVREEVTTYWPIILSSCKNIIKKDLVPTFISTNLKTYIFEKKIEEMRNKNSYFEDVTGTNRAIASNIMNNLDHAIYNEIDYKNIGEKVYNSKANKENINNKSYIQMNDLEQLAMSYPGVTKTYAIQAGRELLKSKGK